MGTTPVNSNSPSFSDIQNKSSTVPYQENATFAQTTTSMISSQTLPNMEDDTLTTTDKNKTQETSENAIDSTLQESQHPTSTDMPKNSSALPSTEKATPTLTATSMSSSQQSASIEVSSPRPTHTTN
ncbi:hypothetical protein T265_06591 [Opisthorchis viverrini]|uniref:Uncharacterized protein n=1 Tax=Opisthorchis viverrini TaxID=6198 RepID=A0A074ZFQ5_OPIVI|nr:hypothetical protein T265_06591 [Opisthorchis viverrini]KER26111.1 hypothetical protein T265_06591 [Opisthorchis viverrini]